MCLFIRVINHMILLCRHGQTQVVIDFTGTTGESGVDGSPALQLDIHGAHERDAAIPHVDVDILAV